MADKTSELLPGVRTELKGIHQFPAVSLATNFSGTHVSE